VEAKLGEDDVQKNVGTSLPADFPIWDDVEVVISHHGEERMLVCGRPKTLEEALRRWYLTQGYSAATHGFKQSSKSMLHLRPGSTIAEIFLRRCHRCDCDASINVQDVEAVLTDWHVRAKDALGARPPHEPNHVRDCLDQRAKPHRGLSTLEMVELLEQGLVAETPEIMFDYFSMYHRCTQIFLDLAATFQDQGKEMLDRGLPLWADRRCHFNWTNDT
jgi:hypothetical protein